MSLQTKISNRISQGRFRFTNPMQNSWVKNMLEELGHEWKEQIILAWKFDLREEMKILEGIKKDKA